MAEQWKTNDSAREMTRKYNQSAEEINRVMKTLVAVNESYVTLRPSEFDVGAEPEDAVDDT